MWLSVTLINKGFQDTKNGFISNAQKYAKNKLTFAKKSKKKRVSFPFCMGFSMMLKKALTTFFKKKRELEHKNYWGGINEKL